MILIFFFQVTIPANKNPETPNTFIVGGGTKGSVASLLAIALQSVGVTPKCFTFSDNSKFLSELWIDSSPFSETALRQSFRGKNNVLFLPNGMHFKEEFAKEAFYAKASLNNRTLHVFQSIPFGLYANEESEKENESAPTIHFASKTIASNGSFELTDSPELAMFPYYYQQRGYHYGLKNMVDRLNSFVISKSSSKNLAQIDTIFPFSQAKEAHQKMDDGAYDGKIVLSMDELWNNNANIDEKPGGKFSEDYVVPSSALVNTLQSGRTGGAFKYFSSN